MIVWSRATRRDDLANKTAGDSPATTQSQQSESILTTMSLIVIGGHSRSVGKTSVVAGLIAALPEYNWTAMKITQHGHGICSADGEPCHCATDDHSLGHI